nr:YbdD/YjiX family protein [Brachybacterium halotolerans]
MRGVRRFARGVLGSDAYDRYLHHHRITGCAHAPLSEKEFWRLKYAEQGENPSAGCC